MSGDQRDLHVLAHSFPTRRSSDLLLFGVMAYPLIDAFGWTRTPLPADTRIATINGSNTATVSDSIFSQYLVPFEAVSVLLLSALVGAIVLARKEIGRAHV